MTSNDKATMVYQRLGKTGMKVSRICLGMMSYGDPKWAQADGWIKNYDESLPFIKHALEIGINFFDTADVYSNGASEEILGRALRELKVPRSSVVIATKCFFPATDKPGPNDQGLSRKHIFDAIDASLRRLQTDHVDLYQIHRFDPETPIEETMEALHDVVKSGKVRYIGASTMSAWQLAKMNFVAEKNGWTKFISMQDHYNLVYRETEREVNPYCVSEGMGLIPWSPLAGGFLAGRNETEEKQSARSTSAFSKMPYGRDDDRAIVERCKQIAAKHNKTCAQVALAWLLQCPGVTAPIIGATKMKHLDDAVDALTIKLTPEDVKSLEECYRPHPIAGLHE